LNTRVLGGPKGINGLPSGHSNLNGSNPGLWKDFPKGILVIKMLTTSLCPKKIEDKTAKDVKRLSDVGDKVMTFLVRECYGSPKKQEF
jgi:hypothetical protein